MKAETFGQCVNEEFNWKSPWVAFVYEVTELSTNKRYIGKKNLYSKKTVEGKKNKQRVESNWRTYCTSNKYLQQAIKKFPENYMFNMLYLCKDDSITSYLESKTMMELGVMESDRYYNGNVKINLMATLTDYESRFLKL